MKKISVGIALANIRGSVDAEQIYSFIESQEGDFETYKFTPIPGKIYAAALDYLLLLNTVASAAYMADILWRAYEKFIAPKKNKDDNAGIIVIIQKDNGTIDNFWIGNTDNSKEIFIRTFSHKIDTIRNSEIPGESTLHTNDNLRVNSLWVRRK